jgi:hypothetical protein
MVDYSVLTGSLDLFELMVNYVAGGIIVSIILWALILFITGVIGRMSFQSILIIICTFLAVSMVGYIGALAAVPIFLWASWYMISGGLNYLNNLR